MNKSLTSSAGKIVLKEMIRTGESPEVIADRLNLWQNNNVDDILAVARLIIWTNKDLSNQFINGEGKVLNVLLGKAIKESNNTMEAENLKLAFSIVLKEYKRLSKL